MPFTLAVTSPSGRRREFAFETDEARLGRTADNDLVVKDKNASRAHCRVYRREGRFWVEDLKSANGTLVNTSVIHGTAIEIRDKDTVTIGDVIFEFTVQTSPSIEMPQTDLPLDDTVVRGGPGATDLGDDDEPDPASPGPLSERDRSTAKPAAPAPKPPPPVAELAPEVTDSRMKQPTALIPKVLVPEPESLPPTSLVKDPASTDENEPPPTALARPARSAPAAAAPSEPPTLAAAPGGSTIEVPAPSDSIVPAESVPSLTPVAQPPDSERRVRRGKDKKPADDSELMEPTAAEKARVRRAANKTTGGKLVYLWGQLSVTVRTIVAMVAALFVVGIVAFVVVQLTPTNRAALPPEPGELIAQGLTVEASFGLGDGVMYERGDMKVFTFKAVSPTSLVGLLHYQAKDITKDEVAISLNGFDLGFVPPDSTDTLDRELEVVLPAGHVKRNEANQIVFDNVRNPPGKDGWRIWNLWLQLLPLPDTSPEETLLAVKEDLDRAQKFYDQREIGPESLFKAWKGYRDAWLKLESLPGRPNDLYVIARTQQAETWRLLDHRCKMMQLDVQRALTATQPDYDTARNVLRDMLRYFPTREHPCNNVVTHELERIAQ